MIGKTVSHYKILEKLGEGGMGEVYLAEDTKLERQVALKFLPSKIKASDSDKKRFLQEAKAAAALNHPNVCIIHDINDHEDQQFIVMEYVKGRTLKNIITSERLPLKKIIDFALQISDALQAAHNQDIIHRDIKSENIMVTPSDQIKVMDFGLAKLKGSIKLTKTSSTAGTVGYMSPETIHGKEVDARSDIFSFGIVLYEMLTGQLPFKGEYEAAMIYSILNEEPEPIQKHRPDLSSEFLHILNRALEKNPEDRYQFMKDLLIDFKRLKRDVHKTAPEPRIASSMEKKKPKTFPGKKVWIGTGIILFLSVITALLLIKPFSKKKPLMDKIQENSLAIMYFENLVDSEDKKRLGEIITNLLITDLSESPHLQVLSSQRLYDILKLMGKEGIKKVDRSVATEVATRARARWMLLGNILQVKPKMLVTTQLVDVQSGNVEASQKVSGEKDQDIFSLVDNLTVEIRKDLSLPITAKGDQDRAIAEVTTHSEEAYRYFLEGYEYFYKHYMEDASKSLKKALEYDPTFAMAYYLLSWISRGPEKKEMIANAVQYSDRVTLKEKYLIDSQAAVISDNYYDAVKMLEKLLKRFPDDKVAWGTVGVIYKSHLYQTSNAIQFLLRAIELDPLYRAAYNQLAYAYSETGDFEKAIWAINKYIEIAPREANPYDSQGEIYAYHGKLDLAIESFKKASEIKPGFSNNNLGHMYLFKQDYQKAEQYYQTLVTCSDKNDRSQGRTCLAYIPLCQGKLKQAIKTLNKGISADEMEKYFGINYSTKHFLKALSYWEMKKSELALTEIKTAIQLYQDILPGNIFMWQDLHIQILAENHLFEDIKKLKKQLNQDLTEEDKEFIPDYWLTTSVIEMTGGNYDAAILKIKKFVQKTPCYIAYEFLGRACLKANRLGEAVSNLEKALSIYDTTRLAHNLHSIKTYYFLGQAYEKSGWNKKAINMYEKFLDIWKNADSIISELQDAKKRVVKLRSSVEK